MHFGRGSRRSIHYSLFIGVLAGSVFSGSGAFAVDPILISQEFNDLSVPESPIFGLEEIKNHLGAEFKLTSNIALTATTTLTDGIGTPFSGILDGGGFKISGLSNPLFESLDNAIVKNLSLETVVGGIEAPDTCHPTPCHYLDNFGVVAKTASDSVIHNVDVSGAVTGGNNVGGLIGSATNSTVTDSSFSGTVEGINHVGGLLGTSTSTINRSHTTGNVYSTGDNSGGLVGSQGDFTISNSYSTADVEGDTDIGGLVGSTYGNIQNSYSSGNVSVRDGGGGIWVGGIVGWAYESTISNSYSIGNVDGTSTYAADIGGIAGTLESSVLENSYSTGNVSGILNVGGIVGEFNLSSVINSFALGTVTSISDPGTFVGTFAGYATNSFHNLESLPSGAAYDFSAELTSKTDLLNHSLDASVWDSCAGINSGEPHLVSMLGTYPSSCSSSDPADEGVPLREKRVEREAREVAEVRSPERIEKTVGFKNETQIPKSAPISFIESTEKFDTAKVKAVEIAPTANVKVSAKAGEALQISLKSESKEPVELWVKSPDGSWLLAGVITFDKDGKAILPPLQFKNAGDYSLVLSKPTADSAKGGAPLNQTGSLLVAVS